MGPGGQGGSQAEVSQEFPPPTTTPSPETSLQGGMPLPWHPKPLCFATLAYFRTLRPAGEMRQTLYRMALWEIWPLRKSNPFLFL